MTQATDELIRGTVDLHYHSAPSPFPRRLDPVEAARHFDEHGFKAVVLKSHHHNTVMDVLTIKASVLDTLRVRVFGGIALNGMVGGLNPRAVELSLRMGGKVVWFPTMSSPAHIAHHALRRRRVSWRAWAHSSSTRSTCTTAASRTGPSRSW